MFGDETWDEDRWEAYLNEQERHADRLMAALQAYVVDYPAPERSDAHRYQRWRDTLSHYLKGRGFDPDTDLVREFLDEEGEMPMGEIEAWLARIGVYDPDNDEAPEVLPGNDGQSLYLRSLEFSAAILDWANALPGEVKDSLLVQFCFHAMQLPAEIAKGLAIGFERDLIGGNIACAKRGLSAANAGLSLLVEMKDEAYMESFAYRNLYETLYELRNDVGLYIIDLRRRFHLGVDF